MKNKDKLLKRIEQTEGELQKLKEELNKPKHPEYIEITKHDKKEAWHYKQEGSIYKVLNVDSMGDFDISTDRFISPEYCKPSTKEAYDAQNEIIRVPDCIKFDYSIYNALKPSIGIIFNEGKQQLFYSEANNIYNVINAVNTLDGSNFKLTKCDRSDLKAGDVAFGIDYDLANRILQGKEMIKINELSNYLIILDNNKFVYIDNDEDCLAGDCEYNHWYKVEKI